MNYELCKKLKDAGFPQEPYRGIKFCCCPCYDGSNMDGLCLVKHVGGKADIKLPSLEELIEACGDKLDCLIQTYDKDLQGRGWFTKEAVKYRSIQGFDQLPVIGKVYKTPVEAVANLYIALYE